MPNATTQRSAELESLTDSELLEMRMRDLRLKIKGTVLENRIAQLFEELAARGIRFRPHFWLSDDWYSPDGIPGIAIPFYLAHKRLTRLERAQLLDVEGGSHESCMKILRHEAGHAIDTAYRLRRRRRYRELFGNVSQPYPKYYNPKPYSKRFVLHLETWYAQSHPVEDFAETFAVWLRPRSRWRTLYRDWPAIKKLEYMDEVMQEVRGRKPLVSSREHVDPLRTMRKTLKDHYSKKHEHYGSDYPTFFDEDLKRLFMDSKDRTRVAASAFLRKNRRELRRAVSDGTGEYQYTIDQVLSDMIDRCRALKLRLRDPEERTRQSALVMLTVQTMNYLHHGNHRIAM